MKYDLHTHSKYSSDGILEPQKLVKIAAKRGFSGIAVTDHNTIKGGLEAQKYENENFKVFVGSEVMTDKGEIIGLFLSEEIKSNDFYDVVAEIRSQDGLVIVPHPFDEWRSSASLNKEDYKLVDCIEVFNSRCVKNSFNKKAALFAKSNKIEPIAGSDAHFRNEIGNAGIITGKSEIKEAILKNDLEVFGKRSTPLNHVLTKILKMRRKYF